MSLINLNGVPSLGSSFDDKIYHLIAYLGLAFLWVTYFKSSKKKYGVLIIFFATFFFGVFLELVQHQLNPNRTYDSYDLMANCLGVLLGTFVAIKINIYKLN
jgi:VanZ family protein